MHDIMRPQRMSCIAVAMLLCGVLASSASPAAQQTAEQKRVRKHWGPISARASTAAAPDVVAAFNHTAFTQFLKLFDDGTELWKVQGDTLARMFWDEIEVAEVVHNFGNGAWAGSNCGYDLSLATGRRSATFFNQWELQVCLPKLHAPWNKHTILTGRAPESLVQHAMPIS
jgi:hypothetical protein